MTQRRAGFGDDRVVGSEASRDFGAVAIVEADCDGSLFRLAFGIDQHEGAVAFKTQAARRDQDGLRSLDRCDGQRAVHAGQHELRAVRALASQVSCRRRVIVDVGSKASY